MTFAEVLAEFHFLRPEWFYAAIPAVLLFTLLRWRQSHHSNWEKAVEPHLLQYILDNPGKRASRSPLTLLLLAWLLATVALAGPVWRNIPQPVHEREDALVVVFDLTRSMLATDVKPNRLVRAKRKLIDLLNLREEGLTALVVYAGDAHVVSPLTDDTNTIAAMIPALTPDIVPAPGSRLAPALDRAVTLFENGGAQTGRILVITDEIRDLVSAQQVARQYRGRYPVSVLSVGTEEGAPIPLVPGAPQRGFLKDSAGNLVIPGLNVGAMQDFASVAGGRYSPMTLTDEDVDILLQAPVVQDDDVFRELERDFDVWVEEGPWLLLLLLPLAALGFRRGWVWCLTLVLIAPTERALAASWDDLWYSRDQQGANALEAGEPERAAELFEDPAWQATANYRGENFEAAADLFGAMDSADGKYNFGNALAKQGLFEEAIEAYDQALALNPDDEDALFNRELIEQLLEQQQQQQQQEGEEGESDQDEQEQQNAEQSEGGEGQEGEEQETADQQQQSEGAEPEGEQQESEEESEEGQMMAADEEGDPLDEEERQALAQWLRRVPDDPGGLLKRKFQQQHDERMKEQDRKAYDANADW